MTLELPRRSALITGAASVLSSSFIRTARGDENGVLTVALSNNPVTCDPINMSSHDTEIISESIFENLMEFDIDGNLKPQLAKAWPEVSADSLIYTFDLRDDVSFTNGQPLTSEDIKYSIEFTVNPANKNSRGPVFKYIDHVETDGPHRVHVHMKQPFAPWMYFLTKFCGTWPAGSREKYGQEYFRSSPKDVGTGPGIFEEWKPNDYVSLRKNPNYWKKGLPHWDKLIIKVVPEDATRVAFLLSGQADIIGEPPPREFARLKTRKGIQGGSVPTFGGWCVMFQNVTRPPFDDINFRKAVQHATDRKTICDKIYYGLVEKSGIPAPASGWWYDKAADESTEYNMDLAKQYLAKSKYATGAEFDIEINAEPYLLDVKDAGVFIQSELAKLGIKVNLKQSSFSVVQAKIVGGDYVAGLANFMSPGEPTYFLMSSFTANSFMSKIFGNQTDPEVEAALKIAFSTTDEAVLKPVYAKLMQHLADQAYFTWIGYFAAANLWRDRVKGFKPSRGLTINVADVSLA
jgi:peptide/nickel transport system substrate-binding protein